MYENFSKSFYSHTPEEFIPVFSDGVGRVYRDEMLSKAVPPVAGVVPGAVGKAALKLPAKAVSAVGTPFFAAEAVGGIGNTYIKSRQKQGKNKGTGWNEIRDDLAATESIASKANPLNLFPGGRKWEPVKAGKELVGRLARNVSPKNLPKRIEMVDQVYDSFGIPGVPGSRHLTKKGGKLASAALKQADEHKNLKWKPQWHGTKNILRGDLPFTLWEKSQVENTLLKANMAAFGAYLEQMNK